MRAYLSVAALIALPHFGLFTLYIWAAFTPAVANLLKRISGIDETRARSLSVNQAPPAGISACPATLLRARMFAQYVLIELALQDVQAFCSNASDIYTLF